MRVGFLSMFFLSMLTLSLITLPVKAADNTAEKASTTEAEKTVQTVCAACHGADGNSVNKANPKLAGQHPAYLLKQLTNFKEGSRANVVMGGAQGIAAKLSTQEMNDLATYFAAQKPTLGKAKVNGFGSLGEKIYRGGIAASQVPACAACHGATGEGLPKQFPRLAGQHADYTHQQLRTFRTVERANSPTMTTVTQRMTDAEMWAVADYMQGLR